MTIQMLAISWCDDFYSFIFPIMESDKFFGQIFVLALGNKGSDQKHVLQSYTCNVTANSVSFLISSLNWFASLNISKELINIQQIIFYTVKQA